MKLRNILLFSIIVIGQIKSSVYTFSNPALIAIPEVGSATPYPSTISVSGIPTCEFISKIRVSINGLTHTFPGDLRFLLVGPNGENFIIIAFADQGTPVTNITITLADDAKSLLPCIPDTSSLTSGIFKPTACFNPGNLPLPAPQGSYNVPAREGSSTFASVFRGHQPNGIWQLFIHDIAAPDPGPNSISNGWTLEITTCGRQSALFTAIRNKFGL